MDMSLKDTTIKNLQVGLFLVDRDGKVIDVNDFFLAETGFLKEMLFGKPCDDFIRHNKKFHESPLDLAMRQKKLITVEKSILKTSSGRSMSVKLVIIPTVIEEIVEGCCVMVMPAVNLVSGKTTKSEGGFDISSMGLIFESSKMQEICYLVKTVAPTDATVLVMGETGTGKEIVSRAIHRMSQRKEQPLIIINCATLSETLLENELFGHEKGAYTGADDIHKGIFETASNGVVFLDEIGEISPRFQAKLLRVLESGEYRRIGSVNVRQTNIRIIAATNKNLRDMVEKKEFREDLFYRLNIFPIKIPPLKDRITDLPILIEHFIEELNNRYLKNRNGISEVALTLLFGYCFPGNVRELRNIIEHAYIKGTDEIIQSYDFPEYLLEKVDSRKTKKTSDDMEEKICRLLRVFNGNKTKVANTLGISRKTLYNKLEKIGNKTTNR